MSYDATRQHVANRGRPPESFLDQLVGWGKVAPDDIFVPNTVSDIYSSVKNTLGPWQGLYHRRAVMLEVMRVLAGFESSWDWNEGRDVSNPNSDTPEEIEAGAWQVSANSMRFGPELSDLVRQHTGGSTDPEAFQARMKSDHSLAMEYVARLLRRTTRHHGPVRDHHIHAWLRRDAVDEFLDLLGRRDGMAVERGGAEIGWDSTAIGGGRLRTPHGLQEIEEMFGRPNNRDGTLNEAWEAENIRRIEPPLGWQLYYQDDHRGLVRVSGIRLHRKLEGSFRDVLSAVWDRAKREIGGSVPDEVVRNWLHERCLDQHVGGFNYRAIRGATRLSLHSYGIAIDWDGKHNPRGRSTYTLPDWWYAVWKDHGWSDGRHFSTPDPMHVQFATGA
ncbi:MAG: M15 family metallopeptidase [bacterium]|nr:M15 family metallopeptidase [bacterium]